MSVTSTPEWFRKRGYIHFDAPIGVKKATKIVTTKDNVSRHAFYPLIHYIIETYKFSKNKDGITEKKKKERQISYAGHLDSHIYSYYAALLSKHYEDTIFNLKLTKNVIAFRSLGKNNIHFANDAFEEIKRRRYCTAIAFDISGFFDNLCHKILKTEWCNLLKAEKLPDDHFNVYRSITKFSRVCRQSLYARLNISKNNPKNGRHSICSPDVFRDVVRKEKFIETNNTSKGIPQGTPISAILSNIYMLSFDTAAKKIADTYGGTYFRYCDDMLFIVPTANKDIVQKIIISEINKVKLDINHNKTEIRDFYQLGGVQTSNRPLQYLGFIFDGKHKLIRSAALAKFSGKMKSGVRLAKKCKQKANVKEQLSGENTSRLFKRKLYERYSHLSKRNFVTYGYLAADIMKSKAIKKQLKPLWGRLQSEFGTD